MGWLQDIAKVLAYPKSVALGFTGFAPGMMGGERYSEGGKTTTGDLDFLREGLRGGLTASDLTDRLTPNRKDTVGAKFFNTLIDIGYDPLLAIGPASKGLTAGTKIAPFIEGANTFGKISKVEDASKFAKLAPRVGQGLRRLNSGTQATGDLSSGLAAAALLGLGENAAAKYLPKIAALSLKGANSQGIGLDDAINNVDELISRPAIDPTRILGELGAGPQQFSNSTDDEVTVLLKELLSGPGPARPASAFSSPPELNSLLVRGELGPAPVPRVSPQFTDSTQQLKEFLSSLNRGNELPAAPIARPWGPGPRPTPQWSPSTEEEMIAQILQLVEQSKTPLVDRMQNPFLRRNIIDLLAE